MNPLLKHYFDVVQKDLILSDNVSSASSLSEPKKINLCLGGNASNKNDVIANLGALKIITNQQPYLTLKKRNNLNAKKSREVVGCRITLRRFQMFNFWYKLINNVFPQIKQFEGLSLPAHDKIYCFVLKDIFVFHELIPLFLYFENVRSVQLQYHFNTRANNAILYLGNSLKLSFVTEVS